MSGTCTGSMSLPQGTPLVATGGSRCMASGSGCHPGASMFSPWKSRDGSYYALRRREINYPDASHSQQTGLRLLSCMLLGGLYVLARLLVCKCNASTTHVYPYTDEDEGSRLSSIVIPHIYTWEQDRYSTCVMAN